MIDVNLETMKTWSQEKINEAAERITFLVIDTIIDSHSDISEREMMMKWYLQTLTPISFPFPLHGLNLNQK